VSFCQFSTSSKVGGLTGVASVDVPRVTPPQLQAEEYRAVPEQGEAYAGTDVGVEVFGVTVPPVTTRLSNGGVVVDGVGNVV
jgi:hypothetical protein